MSAPELTAMLDAIESEFGAPHMIAARLELQELLTFQAAVMRVREANGEYIEARDSDAKSHDDMVAAWERAQNARDDLLALAIRGEQ